MLNVMRDRDGPRRVVSRPPKQHRLNLSEVPEFRFSPSSGDSGTPLLAETFPGGAKTTSEEVPPSELARLESSLTPTNEATRLSANLYLGSHGDSQSAELLKKLGIRHVVNVTDDCCDADAAGLGLQIDRLRISVRDHSDADIGQHFSAALRFVRNGVERAEPVLVHCQLGVSRSATIVLAYLMEYGPDEGNPSRWSYDSAFDYVKARRPQVSPNLGFILALQRFDQRPIATPNKRSTWASNDRRTPSDITDELPPPFASDSDRCETDLLEDSVSMAALTVLAPLPVVRPTVGDTSANLQREFSGDETWSDGD